jgi:hypothetical protein
MLMAVVLVGCATPKAYDWSTQAGTFTIDQAKIEFGPPHSTTRLSDGGTVARWTGVLEGTFYNSRVLHFDKDGKLVSGRGYGRRIK